MRDKTSWTGGLTNMTRLKKRFIATHQAQIKNKFMTITRIIIYGGMHLIENLPLNMIRLLTAIDMEPNYLVCKWEAR